MLNVYVLSVSELKKKKEKKSLCTCINSGSYPVMLHQHQISTYSHYIPSTRRGQTFAKARSWSRWAPKSNHLFLYQPRPCHKMSLQSVHNFLSNVPNRQTNKETNAGKRNFLGRGRGFISLLVHVCTSVKSSVSVKYLQHHDAKSSRSLVSFTSRTEETIMGTCCVWIR